MDIEDLMARLPLPARPPAVSVVRLAGVIGAGPSRLSLANLAATLERAFKPKDVVAVALAINSPGGSPVQSSLIAGRIRQLAEEKGLPVLAFVEDVAASGGYWLACAADEIFVDPASIVGSIGVISAGFGFPELLRRIGVERRLYTQGARKAMLDPFSPERPDEVERLKALQAELKEVFTETVRHRRGTRLKGTPEELFEGDVWTGRRAIELGLADGIGEVRTTLRQRYGEKVRLRVLAPRSSWLRRRLGLTETLLDSTMTSLADRSVWSRFGL